MLPCDGAQALERCPRLLGFKAKRCTIATTRESAVCFSIAVGQDGVSGRITLGDQRERQSVMFVRFCNNYNGAGPYMAGQLRRRRDLG